MRRRDPRKGLIFLAEAKHLDGTDVDDDRGDGLPAAAVDLLRGVLGGLGRCGTSSLMVVWWSQYGAFREVPNGHFVRFLIGIS